MNFSSAYIYKPNKKKWIDLNKRQVRKFHTKNLFKKFPSIEEYRQMQQEHQDILIELQSDDFDVEDENTLCLEDDSRDWMYNLQIRKFLQMYITSFNISHSASKVLLDYLRSGPLKISLPKIPKTLLKTPRKINLVNINPGQYVHYGIIRNLERLEIPQNINELSLSFFIDGMEGSKRQKNTLWPILASIKEITSSPLLIGIYCGNQKPFSSNEYLKYFVEDVNECVQSGFKNGDKIVKIVFGNLICDYPARAFLTKTKCLGYNSCPLCTIRGSLVRKNSRVSSSNSIKFPIEEDDDGDFINYDERIDTDYKKYSNNNSSSSSSDDYEDDFIKDYSILNNIIGFRGCVTSMPLDPMHCIFLGLVKRLLYAFKSGKAGKTLNSNNIAELEERSIKLISYVPREMSGKLRSFSKMRNWKASEFYVFVCYSGISVLKNLSKNEEYNKYYDNFIILSVIIKILCKNEYKKFWSDVLEQIIDIWSSDYKHLYGDFHCTLMVHTLRHFVETNKLHGSLFEYSAFKYESFIYVLKKFLNHNNGLSIQTIINRFEEFRNAWNGYENKSFHEKSRFSYKIIQQQIDGTCESLWFKKTFLSVKQKDSIFFTKENEIVVIVKIMPINNSAVLEVRKIEIWEDLFHSPLNSSDLGIFVVKESNVSDNIFEIDTNALKNKFFCMPHDFSVNNQTFTLVALSDIGTID